MDYLETAKLWAENPCFDIETQEEARKLLKKQNRDLCRDSFGSIEIERKRMPCSC